MPLTAPVPQGALVFEGLSRRFGRLAVLRGVSGRLAAGELLLVSGRNGSGKSTLLRCLAGLLAPDGGKIELTEGGALLDPAGRRARVGLVAPDLAFYGELTAGENLAFFAGLRGLSPEYPCAVAERLGLPLGRPAAALSSGMRQRLRWCFALLHRPSLLLLDEPFQNLDRPGEEAVRELLAGHLAAGGLAVVADPSTLEVAGAVARLDLDP